MQTVKLPQYYCLGLIGRGQFGEVFCAYDYLQQNLVAIKVIDVKRFSTQQFLRELRFLVSLNHPGIVTCQGLKHYNSQRYLIMDYCEGGSLRDLINRGNLKLPDSLQIVLDILSALAHAHTRGIVHCDLKPENILLSLIANSWTAKVSDFGIAKEVEEKYYSVSMGDTGSPAYMAPERFYGKFFPASDLYAVGIMLYELIVGQRPFSGTPKELIAAHLNQTPTIPDQVPFLLRSIILKALEKLPQHRFADAQAMLDSLKNALEVVKATQAQTEVIIVSTPGDNLTGELITSFAEPIISIAQKDDHLYVAQHQSIITPNLQINLEKPIQSLSLNAQNCLAWCQENNQHILYQIKDNQANLLLTIESTQLIKTSESRGKWLAFAHDSPNPELILFHIEKGIVWKKSLAVLPNQLLSIDANHGLAISRKEDLSTRFNVFNRRGNYYEGFSLAIDCQDLVTHPNYPYLLLGTEGKRGLLINLKPLKVSCFALEFTPDFIITQDCGYLLANKDGAIVSVDIYGEILARYQLNLGKINTIIGSNNTIILTIDNYLYQVKLPELKKI
jgi:serine/threonine protein kinase